MQNTIALHINQDMCYLYKGNGCGLRMYCEYINTLNGTELRALDFVWRKCVLWEKFACECSNCPMSGTHQLTKLQKNNGRIDNEYTKATR